MYRDARSRPFRDVALFAAMLLILSGIGLAPLGSSSPGKTNNDVTLNAVELGTTVVRPQSQFTRRQLAVPPPAPHRLDDPKRIRRLLPPGTKLKTLLKGGFVSPIPTGGNPQGKRQLAYAFENATTRTIESNDGHCIVEVLRFESRTRLKIVADCSSFALELGEPGKRWLGSLDAIARDRGRFDVPLETAVEAVLKPTACKTDNGRATLEVDSLSGKEVRRTYVDGVGVQSIEPIGRRLSGTEAAYLLCMPVLADAYFFPADHPDSQELHRVENSQLAGMIDPALRSFPLGAGNWTVCRRTDGGPFGLRHLTTDQEDYCINLPLVSCAAPDGYDDRANRVCAYYMMREGQIDQSETGLVRTARLKGMMSLYSLWQDYFLFDEVPSICPNFVVSYHCDFQ